MHNLLIFLSYNRRWVSELYKEISPYGYCLVWSILTPLGELYDKKYLKICIVNDLLFINNLDLSSTSFFVPLISRNFSLPVGRWLT